MTKKNEEKYRMSNSNQRPRKLRIKNFPENWRFPTTRYRGSKRKILPWLYKGFLDLDFSTVLDIFGGTSTTSLLFKHMGKQVTFNDYLKFNALAGVALIENKKEILTRQDIEFILIRQKGKIYSNFISDTFEDYYYTNEENQQLDILIQNIEDLEHHYFGRQLRIKKALAFWALGQSCLMKRPFNLFHRKNLYLRLSDVDRSFGNKTSWEHTFDTLFLRFVGEANSVVFDNGRSNKGISVDALSITETNYDLVYMDPPYIYKRQRDNEYSIIYHFLEGIADYRNWPKLIDRRSSILMYDRGLMIWPKNSRDALLRIYKKLIERFRESQLVFSYKSGGVVTVRDIERLMIDQGKSVSKKMKRHHYALNIRNGKPRENIEWLVIGK